MHAATCTCGDHTEHRIARRQTADGHDVLLYSDGSIYGTMGIGRSGAAPRDPRKLGAYLAAAWLLADEVCMYDEAEIRTLVVTARRAVQQTAMPALAYLRRAMARATGPAPLRPIWTTLETDRDGTPTVQCWVLPRLRWPGLAVWREHGRYEVCAEMSGPMARGTYKTTGMVFGNLRDLQGYLDSIPNGGVR
jgi:hypothetical protein